MAQINFPDNPSVNDTFTSGDRSWKWNGTTWTGIPSTVPARYFTSTTPPTLAAVGDAWYNTETNRTYVYYDSYWVDTTSSISNAVDASATNSGIVNTGTQTFAGNKTFTGTTIIGNNKFSRENTSNEGGQINLARASDDSSAWYLDVFGSTSTPSLRIVDASAAAVRMSIDESGRINIPSQPAFYGQQTTAQSASGTQLHQDIKYNVGSCYNSSNGRFTAPISGYYFVSGGICVNPGSVGLQVMETFVNGTSRIGPASSVYTTLTECGVSSSGIVYLNANDYIVNAGYSGVGANTIVSSGSWGSQRNYFSVRLIG